MMFSKVMDDKPAGQKKASTGCDNCPMEIKEHCVVALTWTLQDTLGDTLDVLEDPVEFLVGGDDLLPRIEQALQGRKAGDALDLHLEPEDAFGDYDESRVFLAPRSVFPHETEEGMSFDGHALPAGCPADMPRHALYTVTELYPEHVVLDGNHPLAGIALRLHLEVADVREATVSEVGRGSAGAGFFTVPVTAPGNTHRH